MRSNRSGNFLLGSPRGEAKACTPALKYGIGPRNVVLVDIDADVQIVNAPQHHQRLRRRSADIFARPHVHLQHLSIDRRTDQRAIDVGFGLPDLRLGLPDGGSRQIDIRHGLVFLGLVLVQLHLADRAGIFLREILESRVGHLGQPERGLVQFELGLGGGQIRLLKFERRLERSGIDEKQFVAGVQLAGRLFPPARTLREPRPAMRSRSRCFRFPLRRCRRRRRCGRTACAAARSAAAASARSAAIARRDKPKTPAPPPPTAAAGISLVCQSRIFLNCL